MIIPFFIPHAGCPHQCVFCNQKKITGLHHPLEVSAIHNQIDRYIKTNSKIEPAHIAFYGGTFTALPIPVQKEYLEAVRQHIDSGQIKSIRLSTRPDCINHEVLAILQKHHVQTIELGVQSMDDSVLARSGRGHTAAHTINAVKLLKEHGFIVGLQLMAGLPGDTTDTFLSTIHAVILMHPDFVRLYPLLILKDTQLEALYKASLYIPLSLDESISLCCNALSLFEQAGIDVTRIGLQSTEELEKRDTILAGPYHPAFGQLVESSLLLEKMRAALRTRKEKGGEAVFAVNPEDISAAVGQRRSNITKLKKEFGLRSIRLIQQKHTIKKREPILLS